MKNSTFSTKAVLVLLFAVAIPVVGIFIYPRDDGAIEPTAEHGTTVQMGFSSGDSSKTTKSLSEKRASIKRGAAALDDKTHSAAQGETVKPRSYFDDTFKYAFVPIEERLELARELIREYMEDESGEKAFQLGRLAAECSTIDDQEDFEMMIEYSQSWDETYSPGPSEYKALQVCSELVELVRSEGLDSHELMDISAERGVTQAQISFLVSEPHAIDTWSDEEQNEYKNKGRKYISSARNNCNPTAISILAERTNIGRSWELPPEEIAVGEVVSRYSHYLLMAKVDSELYADGGRKSAWVEEILPIFASENSMSESSIKRAQERAKSLYDENCLRFFD